VHGFLFIIESAQDVAGPLLVGDQDHKITLPYKRVPEVFFVFALLFLFCVCAGKQHLVNVGTTLIHTKPVPGYPITGPSEQLQRSHLLFLAPVSYLLVSFVMSVRS